MGKWTGRISTSDAAASWGARLWAVARYLGVDGYINAALFVVGSAVMGTVLKFLYAMPLWVYVPVGLFTGTYAAKLYVAVKQAFAIRGVKKLDLSSFADRCISYHDQYMNEVKTEALRNANRTDVHPIGSDEAMKLQMQRARVLNETRITLAQRFATQALSIVHQMDELRIPQPSVFAFEHSMDGISTYIGVVGHLLKSGDLEGARKLNPLDYWSVRYV